MTGQVGVRNVIDQREVVAKLFDFLGGIRNVTFALALVQAIAALLLISNTVQVSAFTRRTEVGRDAAGRRHPLVHPAAVPDRGGADRAWSAR